MMGGYFILAQESLVGRANLLFLGIIKANSIHFSSFRLVGQDCADGAGSSGNGDFAMGVNDSRAWLVKAA